MVKWKKLKGRPAIVSTVFIILNMLEPPPDIFHDPNALALIGIGVALLAIIVGVIVAIYQVRQGRIQRRLEYTTLSNVPIVSINTSVADQVEIDIKVKGISAKDAHLVVLNVKNTGKASIHKEDYFDPLTFEFGTKVLSASVLNTTPPTLVKRDEFPTFLTLVSQSIMFPPFPLNPNDAVQISVLLEGLGKMEVSGRLDQGHIVEADLNKTGLWDRLSNITAILAIVLGLLVFLTFDVFSARVDSSLSFAISVGFVIFILAIGIFTALTVLTRLRTRSSKK